MANHTPTPWKIGYEKNTGRIYIGTKHKKPAICKINNDKNMEANAEFIVKACNLHEELVKVCKDTLLNAMAPEATDWSGVVGRLATVIAKAEGVSNARS